MCVLSVVLMEVIPCPCLGYHPWQLRSDPAAPLPHLLHHPSSHLWCRQAAQPEQEESGDQRVESRAPAIRYRISLVVQCQVSSGPLQEDGGCRGGGNASSPGLDFIGWFHSSSFQPRWYAGTCGPRNWLAGGPSTSSREPCSIAHDPLHLLQHTVW